MTKLQYYYLLVSDDFMSIHLIDDWVTNLEQISLLTNPLSNHLGGGLTYYEI